MQSISVSISVCCLLAWSLTPAAYGSPIQGDPAEEGLWEPELTFSLQPIHTILLKNGLLLCLDARAISVPDTIVVDPADGSFFTPHQQ